MKNKNFCFCALFDGDTKINFHNHGITVYLSVYIKAITLVNIIVTLGEPHVEDTLIGGIYLLNGAIEMIHRIFPALYHKGIFKLAALRGSHANII